MPRPARESKPEPTSPPAGTRPEGSELRLLAILLLLVTTLTAVAHAPVLRAQARAFDDNLFVIANPLVLHPGWNSTRRFWGEVLEPSSVGGYYLPLTMTSLMLDVAMGGRSEDFSAFHRTHLALHLGCVALTGGILFTLFGSPWAAAIAALLFGLHPLTVEPVAWVSERKTLLATFFALASILCWLRASARGWGWRLASLGAFALALLSKPTVTPLPLMLMVLDLWPRGRRGWRVIWDKWPWLTLAALSGVITTISQARTAPITRLAEASFVKPLLQVPYVLDFYARKIVWPTDLSVVYLPPAEFSFRDPGLVASLIAVALALALAVVLARRVPALLGGVALFLIALSPTLLILSWSRILVYNRYLYFPALGLVVMVAAAVAAAWGPRGTSGAGRRLATAALALAIAAAEWAGTRGAYAHWRDSVALWSQALAVSPASLDARNFLAAAYEDRGDFVRAEREYRDLLLRSPDDVFALINFGRMQSRRGQTGDAAGVFRRAARLVPEDARLAFEWGLVEKAAGRLASAESLFTRTLEIDAKHLEALGQLGTVQFMRGRPDEGLATIRRAVDRAPENPQARFALAVALLKLRGPNRESIDEMQFAADRSGTWILPLTALAWLLATSPDPKFRDGDRALSLAERASRIAPEEIQVLDAHATALAATGEFQAAAGMARRAEALARRDGRHALGDEIAFRAGTYERGRAYVDTTLVSGARR